MQRNQGCTPLRLRCRLMQAHSKNWWHMVIFRHFTIEKASIYHIPKTLISNLESILPYEASVPIPGCTKNMSTFKNSDFFLFHYINSAIRKILRKAIFRKPNNFEKIWRHATCSFGRSTKSGRIFRNDAVWNFCIKIKNGIFV